MHLANGNVTTTLTAPDQLGCFPVTVSALSSGQILLTSLRIGDHYTVCVLYQTISYQPQTLRNNTFGQYISVVYRENFLEIGSDFQSGIGVLDGPGHVVHTVEYDHGFYTTDLAVWPDSVLLINANGALLWLSPVWQTVSSQAEVKTQELMIQDTLRYCCHRTTCSMRLLGKFCHNWLNFDWFGCFVYHP